MPESFQFSVDFPVSPERVYRAWFDSYEHSQITAKAAQISATPGQAFTSLDGYVSGEVQVATPFSHIVLDWKTSDYPADAPPSQVDVRLEATCLGSLLTLDLTRIPDGFTKPVLEVWEKAYLRPLRDYFDEMVGEGPVDIDG